MNPILIAKLKEEKLREAACLGDVEAIESLARDTNVNARHEVNGWTPLHWAAKRGHVKAVIELLSKGADPRVLTEKQETPLSLATDPEIKKLLCEHPVGNQIENRTSNQNSENVSNFIPNYLRNPPVNGQVDIGPRRRLHTSEIANMPSTTLPSHSEGLVIRIRPYGDPDFIEVDLAGWELVSYDTFLEFCCGELNIPVSSVERIRKLPNIRLRNDKDIGRIVNMDAFEFVLHSSGTPIHINESASSTPRGSLNAYQSISSNKDQTILY